MSFLLSECDPNKEKITVYECGFDHFHNPGETFLFGFFLLLFYFSCSIWKYLIYFFGLLVTTFLIDPVGQILVLLFLIVLIVGLICEWVKGGLDSQ